MESIAVVNSSTIVREVYCLQPPLMTTLTTKTAPRCRDLDPPPQHPVAGRLCPASGSPECFM
jgi:hypothetical protein